MSEFSEVGDFNLEFGLPTAAKDGGNRRLGLLQRSEFDYRLKFMMEELHEFITCHAAEDLEGAADALVDLTYVVLGTAHYMGLPFNELWDEVHACNMKKALRRETDPTHKRGSVERIVKPEGWEPPKIDMILAAAREYEKENGHGE